MPPEPIAVRCTRRAPRPVSRSTVAAYPFLSDEWFVEARACLDAGDVEIPPRRRAAR